MRQATSYLFVLALVGAIVASVFGHWVVGVAAAGLAIGAMVVAFRQLKSDGRLDREIQAINKE